MRITLCSTVLLVGAALGLPGCLPQAGPDPSVWREDLNTPIQRQIRLDVQENAHILRADGDGLAAGEAARLGAFLAAQGSPWSMDVRIQPLTPRGRKAALEAEYVLARLGVQPRRILHAPRGRATGEGDVMVTARNIRASAVGCPDWRRANLMDRSELNSSNFGCATADNLARMIADPRELATGRALAPAVGAHTSGAVERYRTDQVKELLEREGGGGGGGGGGS